MLVVDYSVRLFTIQISSIPIRFFFLMILRPPRSTRTDTLFPYTTLFRSKAGRGERDADDPTGSPVSRPVRDHVSRICRERNRGSRQGARSRSEEHTSELQSLMRISYAVFCLKNKKPPQTDTPSYE